jgi:hypothetical protein
MRTDEMYQLHTLERNSSVGLVAAFGRTCLAHGTPYRPPRARFHPMVTPQATEQPTGVEGAAGRPRLEMASEYACGRLERRSAPGHAGLRGRAWGGGLAGGTRGRGRGHLAAGRGRGEAGAGWILYSRLFSTVNAASPHVGRIRADHVNRNTCHLSSPHGRASTRKAPPSSSAPLLPAPCSRALPEQSRRTTGFYC